MRAALLQLVDIAERVVITIGMAVAATLIFIQVVLRYGFAVGIAWAEEITVYAIIWVSFVGAGAAVRANLHLSVDIRGLLLQGRTLRIVERLASFLGLIYSVAFLVFSAELVWRTFDFGQLTAALQIPIWLVYIAMPLSGALMAIRFLDELIFGEAGRPPEFLPAQSA